MLANAKKKPRRCVKLDSSIGKEAGEHDHRAHRAGGEEEKRQNHGGAPGDENGHIRRCRVPWFGGQAEPLPQGAHGTV
jgi:hypothetical protein